MTPTQSRMARAALKWSLSDLAEQAGVGRATVARFELGEGETGPETLDKLRKALADAGADFTRRAGRVGVTVPG
jgi:transcriptional regulator with XRE-family HTH domain